MEGHPVEQGQLLGQPDGTRRVLAQANGQAHHLPADGVDLQLQLSAFRRNEP